MRRWPPKSREILRVTKHLSILLEVGFPPLELTRILLKLEGSPALRGALARVAETIHDGGSLSEGLSLSPRVFNPLYVHVVRAGEVSGRLPSTLKRLCHYLERSLALRRDVIAALIYPSCVMATAAAVSSLLLVFIIPTFKELFANLGTPLPVLTRVVIRASEVTVIVAPYLIGFAVAVCLILSNLLGQSRGKRVLDSISLRLPVWGDLMRTSALARSFRTLATTLDAGIPIMSALEVSALSAGHTLVQLEFERIRREVAEGVSLSQSASASTFFPSLTIEMLEMGERTGSLDTTLENVSNQLEEEVSQAISSLKQLLEPLLIIVVGAIVGTLVVAMYLPIFSMGDLFM